MVLQIAHSTDLPAWELWTPDPGEPSFSANFYTPETPYLRRRVTVTHMSLARGVESRERDNGYVTLPELSEEAVAHWAESDANWLIGNVLQHIEERHASE